MKRTGTTQKKASALTISSELQDLQTLMPMSADDRQRLAEDIKKNGVRHPVIVYQQKGELLVLAGWHRREIAKELGLLVPVEIVEASPRERREFVIKENLARRHLDTAQKAKLIRHLLKADPTSSSRKVAAAMGVHHQTVEKHRRHVDKLSTSRKRRGKDGKEYTMPPPLPEGDGADYILSGTGYVETLPWSKRSKREERELKDRLAIYINALHDQERPAAIQELIDFLKTLPSV